MKKNAGLIKRLLPFYKKYKKELDSRLKPPKSLFSLGCFFLSSLCIAFVLYPHLILPLKSYHLGDIAQTDIRAKHDFLVEDSFTTEKYRQQAREKIPPVYKFDEKLWPGLKTKIHMAFKNMREIMEQNKIKKLAKNAVQIAEKKRNSFKIITDGEMKKRFESMLGINLTLKEFKLLKQKEFSPALEGILFELLEPLYLRGIVENKITLPNTQYGIVLIFNSSGRQEKIYSPGKFLGLKEVKHEINLRRYDFYREVGKETTNAIVKLALNLIQPNIYYSAAETEIRKQKAAKAVKPVFYQVKKGEMIVREGEKIDQKQLLKIQAQQQSISQRQSRVLFVGITALIFVLLWTNRIVLKNVKKDFLEKKSDLFFWLSNILLFLVLSRIALEIGNLLSQKISSLSSQFFIYALPAVGATLLIVLFTEPKIGIVLGSLMAALMGLMLNSPVFFLYFLVGSWWVAFRLKPCRHRSKFIKVGVELGLIQMALTFGILALENPLNLWQMGASFAFAGLGGVTTGIVALGLTPIIEIIFGYTSEIRLLELASLDQPLLKELMVKAPGTYLHSVITSQMAEAAAEEIGANSLLAKVAAYYHDIGKIKKPLYFVENQIGIENKHDRLTPSMSALIIISHVKEGVELAQNYHLGPEIIDIIKQHHGTRLITYFYQKAKEHNLDVKEEDFRYPGPKPQTKEAGLVMLADEVEAACRSLTNPVPSRIETTVQKVISDVFLDGQLDGCELTLKDMHKIAERFSKVLISIFHPRIEYPESPAKKGNGHESKNKMFLVTSHTYKEHSSKGEVASQRLGPGKH